MPNVVRSPRRLVVAVISASTLVAIAGVGGARPADAAPASASVYVPFGPERLADTRLEPCGCATIDERTISVDIAGRPGMPDDVVAVALTVTAPAAAYGFVAVYPSGTPQPEVSTLNIRPDRAVANSAIVQVGTDGGVTLHNSSAGELVVDVTGVFVAADTARAGRFQPVESRRLLDTRQPGPQTGELAAGGQVTLALPSGVASDARALAVNVTSIGEDLPGYLAAYPAGTTPSTTSFVNLSGSGQPVAATAILPVSATGLTISSLNGGHVVVDLLGWFTGPSAPESSAGLFVPIGPQRLLDTRLTAPRIWPNGTIEIAPAVPGAGSLVTNVTATRSDRTGYVAAFPAGTTRPDTSTLNPAMFEHTLANLAITRVSTRGLAYYSHAGVDLVVDVTGMFTGEPVTATEPAAPNSPGYSRVLAVGDSTLAAVPLYSSSLDALIGFEAIVDAASCRRLMRPSCRSDVTGQIPNTAVEAILGTPGRLDIVVVKTGYNDWNSDFPAEFDAVVNAARAKGAHTIVWMSYSEGVAVHRENARRAYQENNADLFQLVRLPQYSDVLLGNWRDYTIGAGNWTGDGTHLTPTGAYLVTDYIARWVAAIEHRACPRPWGPGGPNFDPCPVPDLIGAVRDVRALY